MKNLDDKQCVKKTPREVKGAKFRRDLTGLINLYSLENRSSTPDFILAEYLVNCLAAFDKAEEAKSKWYSA